MRKRGLILLYGFLFAVLPVLSGATRAPVGGPTRYALMLDGAFAGWLDSAEGGNATAAVLSEQIGGDWLAKKHIGNVKYEEVTVSFGTGMSKPFYDWLKASMDGSSTRKNGAIIAADFNMRETSRLEFFAALVTEVGFPALDAASKDAAKMTIKFQPEYTRKQKGSGQQVKGGSVRAGKQWLPANFRLKIDGLDAAMSRVNKIEALVVKQKVISEAVGAPRDYQPQLTTLEVPNLVITLAESHSEPVEQWFDHFVIKGDNGEEQEKGATLEYLASDQRTLLFTLTFKNLGIFRLNPDPGASQLRQVKAEMYAEDIRFSYAPSAAMQ